MRDEYVGLLDELASQCVTDQKCYKLVLEGLPEPNEATSMKEAASAMTLYARRSFGGRERCCET